VKILFCAQHFSYFRNFESTIRALSARGHRVRLIADERESIGGEDFVERLANECPGLTFAFAPGLEGENWINFATKLRIGLEFVRFLDPRYDTRPKYRVRAEVGTPRALRYLLRVPGARTQPILRALGNLLVRTEQLLPPSERVDAFLREESPDVLLLASVTNPGSQEMDYLKAARALGIPVGLTIFSWDHLSGKSWIRVAADRVFVWNETQKREAVEEHFMDPASIEVTGAQCWDQWFNREPSRSREAFCREVGLDASKPFVLYACSVLSRPAPNEARFVCDWIRQLRASTDPRLRQVGVLVRPHPERLDEWRDVTLDAFENVALRGRNPLDEAAKDDYFDSMYHAAAMVGIVTSAFIEAAVVGREVLTIELPEFSLHQRGAPHFNYLVEVAGGLLHVAGDFEQHFAQLADCFATAGAGRSVRNRRFLEAFVRPHGLDVPATPMLVAGVERLGGDGAATPRSATAVYPAWQHAVVRTLASAGSAGIGAWLLMDERDALLARARGSKQRAHERVVAEKEARVQSRQRGREQALQHKAQDRRRKERRRALLERRRQVAQLGRRLLARVGVGSH
jgi:hypothetical protein